MRTEIQYLHDEIVAANLRARASSISRRKRSGGSEPAASWVVTERIHENMGRALSVVLSTLGCSHARAEGGGCTMCSYLLDGSNTAVDADSLVSQFRSAMSRLAGVSAPIRVKVYTSGSFLDVNEVPLEARIAILREIAADPRITDVVLESRPQFVDDESMYQIREILGKRRVEIGIGLESFSDVVRQVCVNKAFSLRDFESSVETTSRHGIGVRAYVLLKPPFITERDALRDSIRTIVRAAELGVTTVSLNPVNVQRSTLVEELWQRGAYRPPWLWTVVEVLRSSRTECARDTMIVCDPVAAGTSRGPHNCGRCDSSVTDAIRLFSLEQDLSHLTRLGCSCNAVWQRSLQSGDLTMLV
ncbi:MAG: archaeosine biosynthesis radical SAM protein RaSEA [Candidatus Thorarchaeota archaeon]